jgi:EmrB/QacA subfamily drug resistance transporter
MCNEVETAPPTQELPRRRIAVIFGAISLAVLPAVLDGTIVATALPSIVGDLGGVDQISWVVTAYLLTQTIATPLFGKFGDLYGRRRLFEIAIALFTVASVLAGASQSMLQLIGARAVQGFAAGGLIVLCQAMIADVVSPRERGRWQGFFGVVFGVASVAGPLVGGFVVDHFTWPWIFFINIPLGIAAWVVSRATLPESPRRSEVRIDWLGTALLSAAIACLVLCSTWGGVEYEWGSPVIVGLALATVVLTGLFVLVERRAVEPAMPLQLFRSRTLVLSAAILFIMGAVMFGTVTYLPTFLQIANGASAANAGLLLVPQLLGTMAASVIAGQIVSRTGRYRIFPILGSAIAAVGMYLLSTMSTDTGRLHSGVAMAVLGFGIGMTLQTLVVATQNEAPVEHLGVATSTISFFRAVGGSIGVALFGSLFTSRVTELLGDAALRVTPQSLARMSPAQAQETATAFADAVTHVFMFAVPLLLLAFALAWFVREAPLRTSSGGVARSLATDFEFAEDALIAYSDPAFVPESTTGNGSGDGVPTYEREVER